MLSTVSFNIMSNSELSSPPGSPDSREYSLPPLHSIDSQTPINSVFTTPQRVLGPPIPTLPYSSAYVFTARLFSRELLLGPPCQIQFRCLFPGCILPLSQVPITNTSTSDLIKHYKIKHPYVKRSLDHTPSIKRPFSSISGISSASRTSGSTPISIPQFLQRGANTIPLQPQWRELLLQYLIANNIALRTVESPSFLQLIQYISP